MDKCAPFSPGICPLILTTLSLAKLGNKNLRSRQDGDATICLAGMSDRHFKAGLSHGARGMNRHLSEGALTGCRQKARATLQTSVPCEDFVLSSMACQLNDHLSRCLTGHLSVQIYATNNSLLLQGQILSTFINESHWSTDPPTVTSLTSLT